ncbi:MAG: NAD(+) synthase, partial [Chloroflexi bacterium]|nr:NAD(+) synthase [Chloroflexota bacterium]
MRIDEALVRRMLVAFLREETAKVGLQRAVVGLSGGVDSAVAAALAAEAFGPGKVLAVHTPYRTSSPASLEDARAVAAQLGIELRVAPITAQIDAYYSDLARGGPARSAQVLDLVASRLGLRARGTSVAHAADRVRVGNKMARERKSIEFDLAWPDGAVIGTSNKTELLLGYGTWFGDMASSLNPVGDLYKTQLRELAALALPIPEKIVRKVPTAELWAGQTDEAELGFTYAQADLILYFMVDRRARPEELVAAGFEERQVMRIRDMVRKSHFKR